MNRNRSGRGVFPRCSGLREALMNGTRLRRLSRRWVNLILIPLAGLFARTGRRTGCSDPAVWKSLGSDGYGLTLRFRMCARGWKRCVRMAMAFCWSVAEWTRFGFKRLCAKPADASLSKAECNLIGQTGTLAVVLWAAVYCPLVERTLALFASLACQACSCFLISQPSPNSSHHS